MDSLCSEDDHVANAIFMLTACMHTYNVYIFNY